MTISELIKELEQYPQDTRVVIRGYEGGVDDVDEVEFTEIYLNCNVGALQGHLCQFGELSTYHGIHEKVSPLNTCIEGKYEKVSAVHLF